MTATLDTMIAQLDTMDRKTIKPLASNSPAVKALRQAKRSYLAAKAALDMHEAALMTLGTDLDGTVLDLDDPATEAAYYAAVNTYEDTHNVSAARQAERAARQAVIAASIVVTNRLYPGAGALISQLATRPVMQRKVLDLILRLDPTT